MNLGHNIRYLRKSRNLTLEQVGDVFGIKRASVAGWESGASRPDLDKLLGLADLFGVSVDVLLYADVSNPENRKQKVDWPFDFPPEKFAALPPEHRAKIEGFAQGVIAEWESRQGNRRAG